MNNIGVCRLCQKTRTILQSHIYPKFMVKLTREQKSGNKFVFCSTDPPKVKPQDGPKEYLLCSDCEQKFSKWEKYYKEFVIDRKEMGFLLKDDRSIEIVNYNYEYVKLFIMSLIWRLSVTKIPNFKIILSSDDIEFLRQLLLSSKPCSEYEFQFTSIWVVVEGKVRPNIFMNPKVLDHPKNLFYIYAGGLLLLISRTRTNNTLHGLNSLSRKKWISYLRRVDEIPFLLNTILEAVQFDD